MKILIVDTGYENYELNEPLGIEVLSEYIINKFSEKISISIVSVLFEDIDKYLMEYYDLLLISSNFNDNGMTEIVIKKAHTQQIIIGGMRATLGYELLIRKFNDIICVIGEGEIAVERLINIKLNECRYLPQYLAEIPNIAYYYNGKIIITKREMIDLEQITTFPKRKYISQLLERGGLVRIEGSRGCDWNQCTFCILDWKYGGVKRRCFSIDKIINEIKYLSDRGVNTVYFTDEEFIGYDKVRIYEFINNIN